MRNKHGKLWLALIAVLALVAASCGDDDDGPTTTTTTAPAADADADKADDDMAEDDMAEDDMAEDSMAEDDMATEEPLAQPGEGVSVTQARANWATGYMQAAIYHDLLEELGYEVSDPADIELAPSSAYVSMADGDYDFWVNSWYPIHNSFLAAELSDGSSVSDHLSVVGEEMPAGGLQGYLTNKSLVDEHDIKTLDQILGDPDLVDIYDAADTEPGDGIIQMLGCPEGWGCRVTTDETIQIAGWDNIEQVEIGSYDSLIAEAVARATDGDPFIVYTWTPSAYVTQLIPGDNAMWLALEEGSVHDGSLSADLDQRGDPAAIGTDQCTNDPCHLAFTAADILVTANNDFLADNPAAAKLLELVKISPIDVALQQVEYTTGGEDTESDVSRHAAEWIEANRDTVNGWLTEAAATG